uniref:Uncharacterized protein n=1 Tax=Glossina brevipalpis TaxID=37001 RepID=A0A1A9W531_9MUSC
MRLQNPDQYKIVGVANEVANATLAKRINDITSANMSYIILHVILKSSLQDTKSGSEEKKKKQKRQETKERKKSWRTPNAHKSSLATIDEVSSCLLVPTSHSITLTLILVIGLSKKTLNY